MVLEWAQKALLPSGRLFIEVRSDKDSFEPSHLRWPMNDEFLQKKLGELGFNMLYHVESKGLAPYKEEDPMIIRVVCQKKVLEEKTL